jgi:dTDP-glucose pyrophosphorylase
MAPVQLVILAAGHGRRFGGLKQLAAVGPNGEAIMDYTAMAAEACGYDSIVVVVREEIRDEILTHIRRNWPGGLDVSVVCQPPIPGTAQAVLAARPALHGSFAVANADDLYGEPALRALIGYFSNGPVVAGGAPDSHLLVAYHLVRTVLTAGPLTRGLCDVDENGTLRAIVEHTVCLREDGRFDARALPSNAHGTHRSSSPHGPRILSGSEWVSMNLWGFRARMLDELAFALEHFDAELSARPELLLPDVVGGLVASGRDTVHVIATDERCIGITHPEDMSIVREEVAHATASRSMLGSRPQT